MRRGQSRVKGSWAQTDRPQMPGRESVPPASRSPAEIASLGLHCRPLSALPTPAPWPPAPVAGTVACHGQPSPSVSTPSPLDGSQCCWEFPSACLPTQHVALPFPPEKVPAPEPKPCRESQSRASPRGPSGHGQELWGRAGRARLGVALPGSSASSPGLNPTLAPFPPPGRCCPAQLSGPPELCSGMSSLKEETSIFFLMTQNKIENTTCLTHRVNIVC